MLDLGALECQLCQMVMRTTNMAALMASRPQDRKAAQNGGRWIALDANENSVEVERENLKRRLAKLEIERQSIPSNASKSTYAMNLKMQMTETQRALAALPKPPKRQKVDDFGDIFIEVARDRLGHYQFRALMDEAHERAAAK